MNIKKNSILLVIIAFVLIRNVSAAAESHLLLGMYDLGNKEYQAGNYDSAVACYKKVADNGIENSSVYYNLANAYFRQNKLGYAILYYEKAKLISPDDEDIASNLKYVRASIVDKITEPEVGFFVKVLSGLQDLLSLKLSTIVTSILFFLICLTIILAIFSRYNGRIIAVYILVILSLIFVISGTSLAYKIYQYENVKYAVVLSPVVDIVNEPDGLSTLFTVHEGSKFLIRKRLNNWLLVSLPNGMSGWIEEKHLGGI